MWLTGTQAEALGPPGGLVSGVERLGAKFEDLDALALMGERAALSGFQRGGSASCGGSCRLLPTADGWVAVSLPRPDDTAAIPAWLELDDVPATAEMTSELWSLVGRSIVGRRTEAVLQRAILLQLAVAAVAESSPRKGVVRVPLGEAPPRRSWRGLTVVDLTALWAGPLCGDLLARQGARVIKVESTTRPDGARGGPDGFFDLLNGTKPSVVLDFQSREGAAALRALLFRADVVIESSRPRALEQLGIQARQLVGSGGPQVWLSITGHGRAGRRGNRIAFGDDAAAAGGLVVHQGPTPMFCADAIADPLTGLAAAGACLEALDAGGRWLLDVSMAGLAAELAGPTLDVPAGLAFVPPRARTPLGRAPALGADTRQMLRELTAQS
jgi:hypothetical protein